jgi:hypothetical protein
MNHRRFVAGTLDGCTEMISLLAVHNDEAVVKINAPHAGFQNKFVLLSESVALQFEVRGHVKR